MIRVVETNIISWRLQNDSVNDEESSSKLDIKVHFELSRSFWIQNELLEIIVCMYLVCTSKYWTKLRLETNQTTLGVDHCRKLLKKRNCGTKSHVHILQWRSFKKKIQIVAMCEHEFYSTLCCNFTSFFPLYAYL